MILITVHWALSDHCTFSEFVLISRSAVSNSFNWTCNVLTWLSWNFVGLLSTASRSWIYHCFLLAHIFKGDNWCVSWLDKNFIVGIPKALTRLANMAKNHWFWAMFNKCYHNTQTVFVNKNYLYQFHNLSCFDQCCCYAHTRYIYSSTNFIKLYGWRSENGVFRFCVTDTSTLLGFKASRRKSWPWQKKYLCWVKKESSATHT